MAPKVPKDTEKTMSKSKVAPYVINVVKRVNLGSLPLFISLGHQGLEKGNPEPSATFNKEKTFLVPKDILKVAVSRPDLYDDVESIELTYSTDKL